MTRSLILKSLLPFGGLLSMVACSGAENTQDTRALELVEAAPVEEVETNETPPMEQLAALEPVQIDIEVVLDEEPEPVETFTASVRSGENLVLIADWAEVSVEDLLAVNEGLDPTEPLFPGQSLAIPLPEVEEHVFEANRQAFVDAKLERYMERRGGLVGVREHRVRTGDTAWGLASNEAEIPMWVLAEFNRDSDLERLSIGERISLPVLGDTVEVAEVLEEEPEPMEELEEQVEELEEVPSPRLEPEQEP